MADKRHKQRRTTASEGGAAPSKSRKDASSSAATTSQDPGCHQGPSTDIDFQLLGTILQRSLEKSLAPLTSVVPSLKRKLHDYENSEASEYQESGEGQNDDTGDSLGGESHNGEEIRSICDGDPGDASPCRGDHPRNPMDQLLDNMAASASKTEETGPPIDPKLASLVNDLLWRRNIDHEK